MATLRIAVLAALLASAAFVAWCGVPESEYKERRARLIALADSDAALVFRAADVRMRSGDVNYSYRQESNFLYLTGITEPAIILLIVPHGVVVNGTSCSFALFCPVSSLAEFKAAGLLSEGVILPAERFPEIFRSAVSGTKTLYVSAPDLGFVNDWLNERALFLEQDARQQLLQKFPGLKIKKATSLIGKLRECKSASEVELIRKAIRLTGDGIRHAMSVCKPGAKEYQLQAAVEYEMMSQGAESVSFGSIVGSGPNSLIPHYDKNRREMHKGEVVVIDVGAEVEGYAADVTRTIPVSGSFTSEQKRVYAVVLKAQKEIIRLIRPGVQWSAMNAKALEVLRSAGFEKYALHGVSHHLGLDVHDAGAWDTLRAGMVVTVEPGIYIPATDTVLASGYRGFGIRIEDDVLVGDKGAVVLSSMIPKDIEAVEKLVRKGK